MSKIVKWFTDDHLIANYRTSTKNCSEHKKIREKLQVTHFTTDACFLYLCVSSWKKCDIIHAFIQNCLIYQ